MATADYMDSKDENLLISIMKQDIEHGARLLMSKYKEPIYWHIRRLVVSHDDAQDAAQETFVRIFRSFRQFKGDCSFKTWIYQIATHEALRLVERQRKKQISIDDPDSGSKELMAEEYVDYSDMEEDVLKEVVPDRENSPKHKTLYRSLLAGAVAVAASIALLFAFQWQSGRKAEVGFQEVEQAFAQLSDEDQNYILDVYQEDLFMDDQN